VADILEVAPQVNVLVVDDNSPDGTGRLADKMSENDKRVLSLHREGKLGLGTAQVFSLQWAADHGYDAAITMDADFSHHPEVIPRLIEAGAEHDYIIGSRYIPGGCTVNWGLRRKLLSRYGNLFAKTLLRLSSNDNTAGYRYVNLHRLPDIHLEKITSHGYGFFIETSYRVARAGIKPFEIPISFMDRQYGKSKMDKNNAIESFRLVLKLRKERKEENGA
jgi:dolichol-phosphate mannosyltransferase